MTQILRTALIHNPGALMDVGTNIGQTLSRDPEVRYIGFEPNPVCYLYCQNLVKENQLKSVTLYPVGLSDSPGTVSLFGDNDHASGATILEDFRQDTPKRKYREIHKIAVLTGDDVLATTEDMKEISPIKIDIEGAEVFALRGMHQTLATKKPVVVLEILPVYDLETESHRRRKSLQEQLLVLMRDLGYVPHLVLERTNKLELVDEIPVHGDMNRTNYVFLQPHQRLAFETMM